MNTIKITKVEGKNRKGKVEFPIQGGRKTGLINVWLAKNGRYFYDTATVKGAESVFSYWFQVQAKYEALRNVQESEVLETLGE